MLLRASLISIFTALLLSFGSCHREDDESPVVASVYGHELHQSDLQRLEVEGLRSEDSLAIVNNYIDQWVRQMVMLSKAEKNVNDDFSRELGEYRNSLLIYSYERQILDQLLDTNVTLAQMEEYYRQNPAQFQLKNSIVKAVYVVAPKKSAADAKLRAHITRRIFLDEDITILYDLATRYGLQGYYDATVWMPFYSLQAVVPITTYNEDLFLRQNRSIVFSDDSLTYYVRILDYKMSDEVAPLELQKENIRAMILNHRKIEILAKLQSDLLAEAERSGNVKRNNTSK